MANMDYVGRVVRGVFGTTLECGYGGMCSGKFGFTLRACDLQKTLGYDAWTSLYSHPKSEVSWSI